MNVDEFVRLWAVENVNKGVRLDPGDEEALKLGAAFEAAAKKAGLSRAEIEKCCGKLEAIVADARAIANATNVFPYKK